MKNNSNKKGILITGTGVVRRVEVIVAIIFIHSLVQTIFFGQEMDTLSLLMMMWSIWILEISLSKDKEKKNEQDS
ncbi:hypothetical protein NF418_08765 [Streptococcus suis]|uniref:hypothetical protein n=1 Tax=Streptococcus suis TaxID=1307 RepID=UPI0021178B81|nr:hypothetical protein [Streptococcus suis]HEP1818691.1 hypothetical protein [Streptococcus suis]